MSSELRKQRMQNQMFVESVLFDAAYEQKFYQELRACVFDTLEEFSEEVPRGITGFILNHGFWRALYMDYHYPDDTELFQSNVTAEVFTSFRGVPEKPDCDRYNRALQYLANAAKEVPILERDKPTVFDCICNCEPLAKQIRTLMNRALADAEEKKPEIMQRLREYILIKEL